MRVFVLLFCVLGLSQAIQDSHLLLGDRELVERQKDLLQLYVNIHQPSYSEQERTQAQAFDLSKHIRESTNIEAVRGFEVTLQKGLLPDGQIFNIKNPIHLQQAIQLFNVFFYARDYASFYRAACWARNTVNRGMFVYSLTVAILNRADTENVAPPPMSEVFPNMFLNSRAIQTAIFHKQQGVQQVVVESNNTHMFGYWIREQMENQVSPKDYPYKTEDGVSVQQGQLEARTHYLTEDVRLNEQWAFEQLKNPAWLTTSQKSQQGIDFLYMLNQLMARYNLERLSQRLPIVKSINLRGVIETGYRPEVQFLNGDIMSIRGDNMPLSFANTKDLEDLINLDIRIADAVDSMEVVNVDGSMVRIDGEDGLQILSNILQNNGNSINRKFYGAINGSYGYLDQCRRVVASLGDANIMSAPSAIELDYSALRDPVLYQCASRVLEFVSIYNSHLKPYTKKQLVIPGIKVQEILTDKLVTYLDDVEVDLFNVLSYQENESAAKFWYKARQLQLNHKRFTYKIRLDSDKNADVIVRVFLGPKYDSEGRTMSVEQARRHFVEIDSFSTTVKTGQNVLSRDSRESTRFNQVLIPTRQMFDKLYQAQQGQAYRYNPMIRETVPMLPNNVMLPLGSRAGEKFVMAVFVQDPQTQTTETSQQTPRPMSFPFDRVLDDVLVQDIPNIHFQTVNIFLKSQKEINNV